MYFVDRLSFNIGGLLLVILALLVFCFVRVCFFCHNEFLLKEPEPIDFVSSVASIIIFIAINNLLL